MSSLISIPNTSKWTLFHNKIDAWWSVDACCYSWSWTPIHCVSWCSPWIAPRSGRTWPPPTFCYRADKKQKKKSAHYFVHLDWFFGYIKCSNTNMLSEYLLSILCLVLYTMVWWNPISRQDQDCWKHIWKQKDASMMWLSELKGIWKCYVAIEWLFRSAHIEWTIFSFFFS